VGTRVIGQRADELWYPGKWQDIRKCSLEAVKLITFPNSEKRDKEIDETGIALNFYETLS